MAADTRCSSMMQLVFALCSRTAQKVMHLLNDQMS